MSVVEANVVDPETARLVKLRELAKRVAKAPIPPVILSTVVEARVEDPEAMKFCAFDVVALVVVAKIFCEKLFVELTVVKFARFVFVPALFQL